MTQGPSHPLMREPFGKKKKYEEKKEAIVSDNELDVSNASLSEKINDLKNEQAKYKEKNQKGMKFKEIIEELIKNEVINKKGEEIISF